MGDEVEYESLLWNDEQSWAFPILPVEENGGRMLIDSGKILMNMIGVSDGQAERLNEEAPPPAPKGKKRTSGKRPAGGVQVNEGKRGGGESDDHELHIWTERERRKKMRNMFSSLHALIPHLHPRADKSTIVDEGVAYIKKLQLRLENLEKLKEKVINGENGCDKLRIQSQSREAFLAEQGSRSKQPPPGPNAAAYCFKTWSSPNVVLNVCGNDAHINVVCSAKKPGILTALLFLMDNYKLDLVSAQVSSDTTTRMYMIHARVNGGSPVVVEETYKQAAAELMLWVDS
ncbi:hypothetical protein C2S52_018088 [Perilla frutescens var. hirtella]|nr:hypothetical protein C2S52_018088 [Perilla frutescens var. hirtella]